MEHKPFKLVSHPQEFTYGWRVLFLKARHKDGFIFEREVARITNNSMEFKEALVELRGMAVPGERIYASAAPRDFKRAQRSLKQAMLDLDYQPEIQQEGWYREIEKRWISALMQPKNPQSDRRLWMTDCDTHEFYCASRVELIEKDITYYEYETRNGWHILSSPHDRSKMSTEFNTHTDTNPMMLWGF